jgi:hypothetical protein
MLKDVLECRYFTPSSQESSSSSSEEDENPLLKKKIVRGADEVCQSLIMNEFLFSKPLYRLNVKLQEDESLSGRRCGKRFNTFDYLTFIPI